MNLGYKFSRPNANRRPEAQQLTKAQSALSNLDDVLQRRRA